MKKTFLIHSLFMVSGLAFASECPAQGLFEQALSDDGGDGETGEEGASGGSDGLTLEVNGYLRGALFIGKVPEESDGEIKSGYAEAALKLRARAGKMGDAFSEIRLWGGYEETDATARVDLREAYVNLYLGPLDIRFGRQIIAWGRADAFNPTDNVTPRDMATRSSDEDDKRMGNLALRAVLNLMPVRLEGIWVPFYRATRMPPFTLPGPITLVEPDYPDPRLSSGTGAFRLHVETPEFEGSVSYLFGYSVFPGVGLEGIDNGVNLAFQPYRHHVAGLDFSTTIADWLGLRGEAAYRYPVGQDRIYVPRPDLQWVLGLDHEFPDNVYVILQYHGRYVFDWDEPAHGLMDLAGGALPAGDQLDSLLKNMMPVISDEITWTNRIIAGQTKRHAHLVIARIEWKLLHETLSMEVLGMLNASTLEWMVRPKITYAVTDALKVIVGGEVYGGPDDSLYGLIDQTLSAGFVEARVSF